MNNLQKQTLKQQFHSRQIAIDSMLKQFKYNEQITHAANVKVLCSCLRSIMDIDDLSEFTKFLSNQENLPIEVNFNRSLRAQQLGHMFDDWLNNRQHSVSGIEYSKTANFKNIIFKKALLQQETTILEYFQALSSDNKIQVLDLYQLLNNILSPYYLYQSNSDTVAFFQKTNSFGTFMKIVQQYMQSNNIFTSFKNKKQKKQGLSLHQLEPLLEFWETITPELTLSEEPRKNMKDHGVQTLSHNYKDVEVQTYRRHDTSILQFINNTLHELNFRIQQQNNPILLKSLSCILKTVQEEKIYLSIQNLLIDHRTDFIQEQTFKTSPRKKSISPITIKNRSNTPSNPIDNDGYISTIYHYLHSKNNALNCSELQILFYHLGLVKAHQNYLIYNLLRNGFIANADKISYKQFKTILKQVSKQSHSKLTAENLKKYIITFIEEQDLLHKPQTPHTRSEMYGLFTDNNKILNKSIFHIDSDGSQLN